MDVLAQDRPAVIPQLGEADAGPSPPGAENVATLLEIVGIGIFLAFRSYWALVEQLGKAGSFDPSQGKKKAPIVLRGALRAGP